MLERPFAALMACLSTATLLSCVPTVRETLSEAAGEKPLPEATATPQGRVPGPVEDPEEIAGEWDIVRFDGHEPRRIGGGVRQAFADFGPEGVALRIECNHSGAEGRLEGGVFRSEPGVRTMTLMGCGPEREARDAALFGFFDRAPVAEWLPDGRLRFTAGSTELLLERPDRRRLAYAVPAKELVGEWRMTMIHAYDGGGYRGIGLGEVPGRIAIGPDTIAYTRCPQYAVSYRLGEDARLTKTGGETLPATRPADCRDLSSANEFGDMPTAWDALRILHGDPSVEWSGERTIHLRSGDLGLELTQSPCESLEQFDDHSRTIVRDCASPR